MIQRKILFLKTGSFSQINNNVYKFLTEEFPDCLVEVYDSKPTKTPFSYYITNIYFFIREYGLEILLGKKNWREAPTWFFATSYVCNMISRKIQKAHKNPDYLFTFQTQSIFNGKLNGIHHFIYTDHTTQTNKLYPGVNPKKFMRSKRFIQNVETKIYQDATLLFTFGSLAKWSLINQYKIDKQKVITAFAGSNTPAPPFFNKQKYNSKNILFVGVDWERKGGPVLVEVFKNLIEKYPDASLTIVGCSPHLSLPNCEIVGKVPLEQVAEHYKNASIFCLPTLREPFGIVFIEAMKYGLPIVANNIGSLPDLVKDDYNGYLINDNIEDYTSAISMLFEDPEKCRQLGENGFNLAQTKFSWQLVGKKIKKHIQPYLTEWHQGELKDI